MVRWYCRLDGDVARLDLINEAINGYDAVLQRELTGLERRVHANGRESVSHAAAASAHDDVAAVVCGALVAASASTRRYDMLAWFDDEPSGLLRQEQLRFNRYVMTGGVR